MKLLLYLLEFFLVFAIAFVVTAVVTYLYNLIFHSLAVVEWDTAVPFGIVLGIVIPWVRRIEGKVRGEKN